MENNAKVYVSVSVAMDTDGNMHPKKIEWEDGRIYEIDKVVDVMPAAARKAGGQGDRYMIRVGGKITSLFFERSANMSGPIIGRWFVERK